MQKLLLTSDSLIAICVMPAAAQSSGEAASRGDCVCPPSASDEWDKDGSVRDAMGDPPVKPSPSAEMAADPWGDELPFEGTDPADVLALWDDGAFEEGEQVPEDIERYQGPDMWEADGPDDVDSDTGRSSVAEKRDGAADDDRSIGRDLTGDRAQELPSDESTARHGTEAGEEQTGSLARDGSDDGDVPPARAARELMDRDVRYDRERLARAALRTAQRALPEARMQTYNFEIEEGQRVVEIAGFNPANGNRVEVDVYPNGRVESVSEAVDLDTVPQRIRQAVRKEVGRFRVLQTLRTIRRDRDLYYEFAGFARSGRAATISIRSDGRDLSVHYRDDT